jgi:hypothetical protein
MKSIIKLNVAMSLLLLIAACGGSNELEKKKLIKNGWVPQNELNGRGFSDAKFVGDELFFKVKTELSKTDNEKIKNTSVSTDTTQQNNMQ